MVRGEKLNKIKIGIGFPVEALFFFILTADFVPPVRPLQALPYSLG